MKLYDPRSLPRKWSWVCTCSVTMLWIVTAFFLSNNLLVVSQSHRSESCCSSVHFDSFSLHDYFAILARWGDSVLGLIWIMMLTLCWPWNCTRNCSSSLSGLGMLVGVDVENSSDSKVVSILCVLKGFWTINETGLCQCNCQFVIT